MKWLEPWRLRLAAPDGAASLFMLCTFAAIVAALSMILITAVALQQMVHSMTLEHSSQASAAARTVRSDLDRALGFGIPLTEMQGVREYLEARTAKQAELRIFAILGANGEPLHRVGIDSEHLERILQQLSPARADLSRALPIGDCLIVREPLRDDSGTVLAAVCPDQLTELLVRKVWVKWPFWIGCLLLAVSLGATAARTGIIEPVGRLAAAMNEANKHGRFFTLLVRRDRDAIGSCLFSFNASVAGLHAHLQSFVTQAETVRHAVFDPAVAEQVSELRNRTLSKLGEGLAKPPERIIDARASDADFFAISLAAAGAMGLTTVVTASLSTMIVLLVVAGLAAGAGLGIRLGYQRRTSVPVAVLLLLTVFAMGYPFLLHDLSVLMALVSASAFSLAGGVALAQRRAAARHGGISGGGWSVFLAGLSGIALASVLVDDPLTTAICMALLSVLAALVALFSKQE